MAKLNQQELESIRAYIEDLSNGEIDRPFAPKEDFCIVAKNLIVSLENLRKEIFLSRSRAIEDYAQIEQEIANVTHDLKTPLAVITGAVECLEDGINDKDYVQVIKNKTQEMNETVLRIISSSRTLAEESKNKKRVISARDFFPNILEKYRYLIEGKKIKYSIKRIPNVLIAVAENELTSVIDNLLTNATKYTEKGKITIGFNSTKKFLTLHIKDTGVGISEKDLPYIFNRFYSGDKSRQQGGTGIGLNYVKTIVESHGGIVNVVSKEGKGSTFSISLPRAETKRMKRLSRDQAQCIEASLRLFLFPFFWPYDLGRAIYFGLRHSKNIMNYYLDGKE